MPISSTTVKLGSQVPVSIIQERISRSLRIKKERAKLYLMTYNVFVHLEHRRESMLRLTQIRKKKLLIREQMLN